MVQPNQEGLLTDVPISWPMGNSRLVFCVLFFSLFVQVYNRLTKHKLLSFKKRKEHTHVTCSKLPRLPLYQPEYEMTLQCDYVPSTMPDRTQQPYVIDRCKSAGTYQSHQHWLNCRITLTFSCFPAE
jgi:hypothetical protein